MTNRHSFVLGLFITASLLCASRTVWGNSEINTYTKTDFAMDTVVSETLYTTGEDITADIISMSYKGCHRRTKSYKYSCNDIL